MDCGVAGSLAKGSWSQVTAGHVNRLVEQASGPTFASSPGRSRGCGVERHELLYSLLLEYHDEENIQGRISHTIFEGDGKIKIKNRRSWSH